MLVRVAWDVLDRVRATVYALTARGAVQELGAEWAQVFKADAPRFLVVVGDETWPLDDPRGVGRVVATDALSRRLSREVPPPLPRVGEPFVLVDPMKVETWIRQLPGQRLSTAAGLGWLLRRAWAGIALGEPAGEQRVVHELASDHLLVRLLSVTQSRAVVTVHRRLKKVSIPRAPRVSPTSAQGPLHPDAPWPSGERSPENTSERGRAGRPEGGRQAWDSLSAHLGGLGFDVRRMSTPFEPPELAPRRGLPANPLAIDSSVDGEFSSAEVGWAAEDSLGRFVVAGADLPPGIHLFCGPIRKLAEGVQLPLEALVWHVFWHECGHAWLHALDGRTSALCPELRPFDIEEAWCEAQALSALRSGRHVPTGLHGPALPRQAWRLERWRIAERLWPYAGYRAINALSATVPDEHVVGLVRLFRHLGGRAHRLLATEEDVRARVLVADVAELIANAAGTPWARRCIDRWAALAPAAVNLGPSVLSWSVYLWGA